MRDGNLIRWQESGEVADACCDYTLDLQMSVTCAFPLQLLVMEARETTFGTLLNGRVQYRVPLFQRQYNWEPEHRRQLWSDILELYEERRNEATRAQHFLGSVVTAPEQLGPNRPAVHTLIDGQQR